MEIPHILLVDDEVRFTRNLAKLLENRGFNVFIADNGNQALNLLRSKDTIAVVVLDVCMPGPNGFEVLEEIKKRYPDIEVIMLTGQASKEDGVQALRRGAFDYVQKPCDIRQIESRIRAAVQVEYIKRHPVLWHRSKAGDLILSGFIPLHQDDSIAHAVTIFDHYHKDDGARILFVVDDRQHAQGVLLRSDLLHLIDPGSEDPAWDWVVDNAYTLEDLPVKQIMHHGVATVSSELPLSETADRMLQHHYDSIPVISDNKVVGVVRLRDVLHHLQAAGATDAC